MLMPETALVPATGASIKQNVWLVVLNVAISEPVGTWPSDQFKELFQLLGGPIGAAQVLMVAGRQRSSRASSRGRKNERPFRNEERRLPRLLPRSLLALDMLTSCAGNWFLSRSQDCQG
jgi:hypothetical protein